MSTALASKARANKLRPDQLLEQQAREVSRLLSVLANENRLLILCQLAATREMPVGDIADAVVANAPAREDHFFVVPKVVE